MELRWQCAICDLWFSGIPDLRYGVHFPTKDWARANGFPVQDGRWISLVPPELRVVTGRVRKKKPRGLFEPNPELPAPDEYNDPEPDYSENIEDYEA